LNFPASSHSGFIKEQVIIAPEFIKGLCGSPSLFKHIALNATPLGS
jgi:hypothetical protein